MNRPEDAPLRDFIKDYPIMVTVYDKDDRIIRTERMNYGNYQDKKWLGKLSHFYWGQGCTVETRKI